MHPYMKEGNWEFCLHGICLWFLCLLLSSGPWLYNLGKKKGYFLAMEWILKHDLKGACGQSFLCNGYLEKPFEGLPYFISWERNWLLHQALGVSNSNLSASIAVCFESLLRSLKIFSSTAFLLFLWSLLYRLCFYLYVSVLLSVYILCALFVYGNCPSFLFIFLICPSPVPSISHSSYRVFFELMVFMKREE